MCNRAAKPRVSTGRSIFQSSAVPRTTHRPPHKARRVARATAMSRRRQPGRRTQLAETVRAGDAVAFRSLAKRARDAEPGAVKQSSYDWGFSCLGRRTMTTHAAVFRVGFPEGWAQRVTHSSMYFQRCFAGLWPSGGTFRTEDFGRPFLPNQPAPARTLQKLKNLIGVYRWPIYFFHQPYPLFRNTAHSAPTAVSYSLGLRHGSGLADRRMCGQPRTGLLSTGLCQASASWR
jgi:hypothetical protein